MAWQDVTSDFSGSLFYICDLTLGNLNPIDWTLNYNGVAVPSALRISCTMNPDKNGTAAFAMAGYLISSSSNQFYIQVTASQLIDVLEPSDYPISKIQYSNGEYVSRINFYSYFCECWQWSPDTSTTFTITKIEFMIEGPDLIWTSKINTAEITQ